MTSTSPDAMAAAISEIRIWANSPAAGSGDYYSGHDSAREAVIDILESHGLA